MDPVHLLREESSTQPFQSVTRYFALGISRIKEAFTEEGAPLLKRILKVVLGILEVIPFANFLVGGIDSYFLLRGFQITSQYLQGKTAFDEKEIRISRLLDKDPILNSFRALSLSFSIEKDPVDPDQVKLKLTKNCSSSSSDVSVFINKEYIEQVNRESEEGSGQISYGRRGALMRDKISELLQSAGLSHLIESILDIRDSINSGLDFIQLLESKVASAILDSPPSPK